MRVTVILVPGDAAGLSVMVPSMPGCFSAGRTREQALANVEDAITGWVQVEAQEGRGPLPETPDLVLEGVSQALAIIDEMRSAGELTQHQGYDLELATVSVPQLAAA